MAFKIFRKIADMLDLDETSKTAGNVVAVNATEDGYELVSPSAGGTATSISVAQNTHGFAVGDVVRISGANTYTKAQADSAANAEVAGIVSAVADVNNFTLTTAGDVTGLSGLTAGTVYFLSPSSAGALTSTEPTAEGDVSKPILIARSTTAGEFFNMRGELIPTTTPTSIYIATTGSDTTGDGTSGTPYATLSKALAQLPDQLDQAYTIVIADGTYAEPIALVGFHGGRDVAIKLAGNATTPANVKFTGTQTSIPYGAASGTTLSVGGVVDGSFFAELEGITIETSNGNDAALFVQNKAHVIVDRCVFKTGSGTTTRGVFAVEHAGLEFQGDVTIQNWSSMGLAMYYNCTGHISVAGTLTITGPGSSGWGVHIGYKSQLLCETASCNITITGVVYGFQLGIHGAFQHVGSSSTITVDNVSTPGSSAGVNATDLSSWSTNQTVVIDHVTNAFEANSICYIEATGTRTITNVSSNSSATQNSVISLP